MQQAEKSVLICEVSGHYVAFSLARVTRIQEIDHSAIQDEMVLVDCAMYLLKKTALHNQQQANHQTVVREELAVVISSDQASSKPMALRVDGVLAPMDMAHLQKVHMPRNLGKSQKQSLYNDPFLSSEYGIVWRLDHFMDRLARFSTLLDFSKIYLPLVRMNVIIELMENFYNTVRLIQLLDTKAYADVCSYNDDGLEILISEGERPAVAAEVLDFAAQKPIQLGDYSIFSRPFSVDKEKDAPRYFRLFLSTEVSDNQASKTFQTFIMAMESQLDMDRQANNRQSQSQMDAGINAVINNLEQGVFVLDAECSVLFSNDTVHKILSIDRGDEQQIALEEMVNTVNDWLVELAREVLETNGEVSNEDAIYFIDHEQSIVLDVTGYPFRYRDRDGVALVVSSREEERQSRNIMDRYIGSGVTQEFIEKNNYTRRKMTIMFCDLNDFTGTVERLGPATSLPLLNRYFTFMEDVISNNGGQIDKFIGDEIMAFFGIDNPEESASIAMKTALDMYKALEIFNMMQRAQGDLEVNMRMGLATGDMILGTIGSEKRSDFSVIGDTVNTAARIVTLNKAYSSSIMVDDATQKGNKTPVLSRNICTISLRGKSQKTTVHEVHRQHYDNIAEDDLLFYDLYDKAKRACDGGQYGKARTVIDRAFALRDHDPALTSLEKGLKLSGG